MDVRDNDLSPDLVEMQKLLPDHDQSGSGHGFATVELPPTVTESQSDLPPLISSKKNKKTMPKEALSIDIHDKVLAPNAANMNGNMTSMRSVQNSSKMSINVIAATPGSQRSHVGEQDHHTL